MTASSSDQHLNKNPGDVYGRRDSFLSPNVARLLASEARALIATQSIDHVEIDVCQDEVAPAPLLHDRAKLLQGIDLLGTLAV